jgi:hypothetical protein
MLGGVHDLALSRGTIREEQGETRNERFAEMPSPCSPDLDGRHEERPSDAHYGPTAASPVLGLKT